MTTTSTAQVKVEQLTGTSFAEAIDVLRVLGGFYGRAKVRHVLHDTPELTNDERAEIFAQVYPPEEG